MQFDDAGTVGAGSAGEGFSAHEIERSELAVRALLRKAQRAREDVVAFFEFAMREELTGARLTCAPHQRVLFSFIEHHDNCVVRMPVGSSKTFCLSTYSLWLLGRSHTERGAFISSAAGQAQKPLSMVVDYIENERNAFPELRLVFPELRPSQRAKDPWQQDRIVVDRPPGIRDPSIVAIGYGGKLPGSRLSWILVDDILDAENTATAASRQKVNRWVNSTVLSREDVGRSKMVVTNTPWNSGGGGRDSGDLTFTLERGGWPTITMDAEGDITISNASPDWDCDDIRPSFGGKHKDTNAAKGIEVYRLSAHDSEKYGATEVITDPKTKQLRAATAREIAFAKGIGKPLPHYDVNETIPLWPEKFGWAELEKRKRKHKEQYAPLFRCVCRDDETALCKLAWLEACKKLGFEAGFTRLATEYRGTNPTITGIDLAFGLEEQHDWTAFVTIEMIPIIEIPKFGTFRNVRRLLDVEYCKLEGTQVRDKALAKAKAFRSFLKVETNAGQILMKQMLLEKNAATPVLAHTTGVNKHHRHFGVVGVFTELSNGAWLIPSNYAGDVDEKVQMLLDGCLGYAPGKHVDDGLMAMWIARSFALNFDETEEHDQTDNIAQAIAAR